MGRHLRGLGGVGGVAALVSTYVTLFTVITHLVSLVGYRYYITVRRVTIYVIPHISNELLTYLLVISVIALTYLTLLTFINVRKALVRLVTVASLVITFSLVPSTALSTQVSIQYILEISLVVAYVVMYVVISYLVSTSYVINSLIYSLIVVNAAYVIPPTLALINVRLSHLAYEFSFLAPSLWGLIQWLSPLLVVAIFFHWVFRPLTRIYINYLSRYLPKVKVLINRLRSWLMSDELLRIDLSNPLNKALILILATSLSVLVYVIPYSPTINPQGIGVSVDWRYYFEWLNNMDKYGPLWALSSKEDRFIYLWILYAFKSLTKLSNYVVAAYHNIVLMALLTLATWYLAREVYGEKVGVLAALITPFSYQATSFMYGGFQANQLALAFMYVALGLVVNPCNTAKLAALITILLVTPYIHPWCWIHVASAIALVSIARLIKRKYYFRESLIILVTIISSAVIRQLMGGWTWEAFRAPVVATASHATPTSVISGLIAAFSYYMWCVLNVPIVYIATFLTIYLLGNGGVRSSDKINPIHYLLITSSFILPISNRCVITRLVTDVPLQIEVARISNKLLMTLVLTTLISSTLFLAVNSVPIIPRVQH